MSEHSFKGRHSLRQDVWHYTMYCWKYDAYAWRFDDVRWNMATFIWIDQENFDDLTSLAPMQKYFRTGFWIAVGNHIWTWLLLCMTSRHMEIILRQIVYNHESQRLNTPPNTHDRKKLDLLEDEYYKFLRWHGKQLLPHLWRPMKKLRQNHYVRRGADLELTRDTAALNTESNDTTSTQTPSNHQWSLPNPQSLTSAHPNSDPRSATSLLTLYPAPAYQLFKHQSTHDLSIHTRANSNPRSDTNPIHFAVSYASP